MRVIAGKAGSIPLKCLEGVNTRPTTDRIKETLFNMISDMIPGSRFLDLFSGSGAIGIEALSRGAAKAVFVEKNGAAVKVIRDNLSKTRLTADARVIQSDCRKAITLLEKEGECFDIVFMDPPYDCQLEQDIFRCLKESSSINDDTLIITEASLNTPFSYLEEMGFQLIKTKKYKTNMHIFVRRIQEQ